MPTLTFPPRSGRCESPAGGARTGSDARCPSGDGVCRSYALTESRAGFENLSDFYREFLANYFDDKVGDKAAGYAAVASMTVCPQWASDLKNARHDVLHGRSMWIAFEVRDTSPSYEPLLLLNWRPGRFQPEDCIKFQTLCEIRDGLLEAAEGMRHRLIQKIQTLP